MQIFYEAVLRLQADQTIHAATVTRVGHHANKNDWKRFTKKLENTWREIEHAAGRPIIKTTSFFRGLDGTIASFRDKKQHREGTENGAT